MKTQGRIDAGNGLYFYLTERVPSPFSYDGEFEYHGYFSKSKNTKNDKYSPMGEQHREVFVAANKKELADEVKERAKEKLAYG